jgi:hypothetical protein
MSAMRDVMDRLYTLLSDSDLFGADLVARRDRHVLQNGDGNAVNRKACAVVFEGRRVSRATSVGTTAGEGDVQAIADCYFPLATEDYDDTFEAWYDGLQAAVNHQTMATNAVPTIVVEWQGDPSHDRACDDPSYKRIRVLAGGLVMRDE